MPAFGALVTAKETALPLVPVFAQHRDGTVKQLLDVAPVAANFTNGDFIQLGSLPSNAVILPNSYIQTSAGNTSMTVAVRARVGTGTAGALGPTLLAAAVAATAAVKADAMTRPMSEWGQQLWQIAGLPADPGGRMTVEALIGGANGPGSAWNIAACIFYT